MDVLAEKLNIWIYTAMPHMASKQIATRVQEDADKFYQLLLFD